jgi:hypothetical protein
VQEAQESCESKLLPNFHTGRDLHMQIVGAIYKPRQREDFVTAGIVVNTSACIRRVCKNRCEVRN